MKIRISQGVGSNPKLWARTDRMVGEFDVSDEPGSYDADANGISGMSGIVWKRGCIGRRTRVSCTAPWMSGWPISALSTRTRKLSARTISPRTGYNQSERPTARYPRG